MKRIAGLCIHLKDEKVTFYDTEEVEYVIEVEDSSLDITMVYIDTKKELLVATFNNHAWLYVEMIHEEEEENNV